MKNKLIYILLLKKESEVEIFVILIEKIKVYMKKLTMGNYQINIKE